MREALKRPLVPSTVTVRLAHACPLRRKLAVGNEFKFIFFTTCLSVHQCRTARNDEKNFDGLLEATTIPSSKSLDNILRRCQTQICKLGFISLDLAGIDIVTRTEATLALIFYKVERQSVPGP